MQIGIQIASEPIKTLDWSNFTEDAFRVIGDEEGISHPAHIIIIQNLTNVDLLISDSDSPVWPDSAKYVIAARQGLVIDCTTNRTSRGGSFCYREKTRFYAANLPDEVGPSSGAIWLSSIYALE